MPDRNPYAYCCVAVKVKGSDVSIRRVHGIVAAASEEEAIGMGVKIGYERYRAESGWRDHVTSAWRADDSMSFDAAMAGAKRLRETYGDQ